MLVNLMAKTDLLNTRLSRRRMMLAGLAALALNGAVSPLAHAHGLPRPKPQGARKRFLVMLIPVMAASTPAPLATPVRWKNMSFWRSPKMCVHSSTDTASMPA